MEQNPGSFTPQPTNVPSNQKKTTASVRNQIIGWVGVPLVLTLLMPQVMLALVLPYLYALLLGFVLTKEAVKRVHPLFPGKIQLAFFATASYVVIELAVRKGLILFAKGVSEVIQFESNPGLGALAFIFGSFISIGIHILLFIVLFRVLGWTWKYAKENAVQSTSSGILAVLKILILTAVILAALILPRMGMIEYFLNPPPSLEDRQAAHWTAFDEKRPQEIARVRPILEQGLENYKEAFGKYPPRFIEMFDSPAFPLETLCGGDKNMKELESHRYANPHPDNNDVCKGFANLAQEQKTLLRTFSEFERHMFYVKNSYTASQNGNNYKLCWGYYNGTLECYEAGGKKIE